MQFKLSLLAVGSLSILAAADPVLPRQKGNLCNTGSAQCCNNVLSSSNSTIGLLAGLLGIVLSPITGLIGLNCTPLGPGDSCPYPPVCCAQTQFGGLIALGCTPI